jgi:hypothetical protein
VGVVVVVDPQEGWQAECEQNEKERRMNKENMCAAPVWK